MTGSRLFEMINLVDMLGRMAELEADPFAMPAGRKTSAHYRRDLVRHLGVRRIVGDRVDPRLRDDFTGPVFLCHGDPPRQS
jgi:hypothetical protein